MAAPPGDRRDPLASPEHPSDEPDTFARAALAAMAEGVIVLSATGDIVSWNPAAESILGLARDQMAGRSTLDPRWRTIHEDGSPFPGETHPAIVSLATGQPLRNVVMGVHRPDGSLRWISINSVPMPGPDGRPASVVTTFVDITERRLAEEAAQQREENFRGFFDAIDDCLFVLDERGTILHVNRATTLRLGYEADELVGRSVLVVHPPERREEAAGIVAEIAAGRARLCPVPLQRKDGRSIPVETRAFPGRWNGREVLFGLSKDLSELIASQEKFERTFRDNPSPMVLRSLSTDKIVDVNRAFTEMLGFAREEVVGEAATGLRAIVDPARRDVAVEGAESQGSFRDFGMDAVTADGRTLHGLFSGEVIELQDDRLLLTVMKDVTALREAERELRAHRELLRQILDLVPQAIFWKDRASVYLGCNEYFARVAGLQTPDQVIGKSDLELPWKREESEAYRADDADVIATGLPKRHIVERQRRADGTDSWVETSKVPMRDGRGEAVGVLGIYDDITERKQAEDALLRAEQQLRTFFDRSPVGKAIATPEGRLLRVNQAFCSLLGYSAEELLTRTLPSLIHPDDLETVRSNLQANLDGTLDSVDLDLRHLTRDGEAVWTQVRGAILRDPAGQPVQLMAHIFDIRDRKAAEVTLLETNEALEARVAERTASLVEANRELEAYSYSVAHELRAPLRAIDSFVALLAEEAGERLDEEHHRQFARIRWNAQRMGQLIDDLLTFSRTRRADLAFLPVDMSRLAKEAVASVRADPARLSQVTLAIDRLPQAIGDSVLLKRVWENLLSNAVKFSSGQEQPQILVSGRDTGDELVYSVQDNGVGFDMAYVDKLFGVFHRLHAVDEFEGTGVGLALVRRIVLRHGGRVWAESTLGQGATFSFALPAHDRAGSHGP